MLESKHKVKKGPARQVHGPGQHGGGTYVLDAAWRAAPVAFRQRAARRWQQHRDE